MMATTIDLKTQDGGTAGSVTLDAELFGIEPNLAVLHQVVTAQLAARRSGSANTKLALKFVAVAPSPTDKKELVEQGRDQSALRNSPAAVLCMALNHAVIEKK